jgi:hypothetical protein
MRTSLFFLWPLVHHSKVILTNWLPIKESINSIQQLQNKYKIEDKNILFIQETREKPFSSFLSIAFADLLNNKQIVPSFHTFSKFHHQVIYARYQNMIPYNVYCLIEENLARILLLSLQQEENHMIIFENLEWFYDESILSYLTGKERENVYTCMLVNLDIEPKIQVLPNTMEKRFFWSNNEHKTI